MKDLHQIQQDLGKCSEDPDRYMEKLWGLTQSFDLTWWDVTVVLNP